jgi:hypothetical protein
MMVIPLFTTALSPFHQDQAWKDSAQKLGNARRCKVRIIELVHQLRPAYAGNELLWAGHAGDGGYLLSDDLSDIQSYFSPGVHTQISFDRYIASFGIRVDPAVASESETPSMSENMALIPNVGVGVTNEQTVTMQGCLGQVQEEGEQNLRLQRGIEGSEYEDLAIQFHMLDQLWKPGFLDLISRLFQLLLISHEWAHLRPNNYCGAINRAEVKVSRAMGFIFVQSDRIRGDLKPVEALPHPLDMDNKTKPILELPGYWR